MLLTNAPNAITLPFAASGDKNVIPASGATGGEASYDLGFPPITSQPLGAGGIPPDRLDFNGILYALSQFSQYQRAGGTFIYNSAFATAIGGYPEGAVVLANGGGTLWMSLIDNNLTNPDNSGSANWVRVSSFNITQIPLSGSDFSPVGNELANKTFKLIGALTANVNLLLPNTFEGVNDWIVINQTTGPFSVTVKPTGGTGPVIPQGLAAVVVSDATTAFIANAQPFSTTSAAGIIQLATQAIVNALTNSTQAVAPSTLGAGFLTYIGGTVYGVRLPQWLGGYVINMGLVSGVAMRSTTNVTFGIPFSTTFMTGVYVATASSSNPAAMGSVVPIGLSGMTIANTQDITSGLYWLAIGK